MPRIPAAVALAGGVDVVVDGVTTRGLFTHTTELNLLDEDIGQANQVRIAASVPVGEGSRITYNGEIYEARGTTQSPDTGTTVVQLSEALFATPASVFPAVTKDDPPLPLLNVPDAVLEAGRALDAGDAEALGGWEEATTRGLCARLTVDPDLLVSGVLFEWGDVVLSVSIQSPTSSTFVIRDGEGQVATWQQGLTDEVVLYVGGSSLRRYAFFNNTYTLRGTRTFAAAAEGGGSGNPGIGDIYLWTNVGLDDSGDPIRNSATHAAIYGESTSLTETYLEAQRATPTSPPVATLDWAVNFDWLTFAMEEDSVVLLSGKGALANPGTFNLINGALYHEGSDYIDATADSGGTSAARLNLAPAAVAALRDATAVVVGIQLNRTGGDGEAVELVRVGGGVNLALGINAGNIDYQTRNYGNAGGGVTPNFWHSAVFTDRRYYSTGGQRRANYRLYLDGAAQSSAAASAGGNLPTNPLDADLQSIYIGGGSGTGSAADFDRWVRQFTLGIPRAGHTTTDAELANIGARLSNLGRLQRGNLGIA